MNYQTYTNKQLAQELRYMSFIPDLANSEFELLNVVIDRLKMPATIIDLRPAKENTSGPSRKRKEKKKAKPMLKSSHRGRK